MRLTGAMATQASVAIARPRFWADNAAPKVWNFEPIRLAQIIPMTGPARRAAI
jgi:hypothetical protein